MEIPQAPSISKPPGGQSWKHPERLSSLLTYSGGYTKDFEDLKWSEVQYVDHGRSHQELAFSPEVLMLEDGPIANYQTVNVRNMLPICRWQHRQDLRTENKAMYEARTRWKRHPWNLSQLGWLRLKKKALIVVFPVRPCRLSNNKTQQFCISPSILKPLHRFEVCFQSQILLCMPCAAVFFKWHDIPCIKWHHSVQYLKDCISLPGI